MLHEVWKVAPGFAKYEVSSLGRMRRRLPGRGATVGRIIHGKPEKLRKGYIRACIMTDDENQKSVSIHRLVCEAFNGPPPTERHHAAHRNGINTDNRAANLYWATPKENERDKLKHGRRAHGERHGAAKLTAENVRSIRSGAHGNAAPKDLARMYSVDVSTIHFIIAGKTWRYV